jgi:diguanylate cyclase (GGDEF)-like protein
MPTNPNRRRHDGDPSDGSPSIRVLLVDDDDHFRTWLTVLMRRLGFAVEAAADGVDALARLNARPFDVVISDLEMPRMNGLELIREIRETPALYAQYALMLTSHEDVQSKVEALTLGYDDFLSKSCTEVEVVAKIVAARRLLSRQPLVSVSVREWQALAMRDELTGVALRRTFFDEAERLLAEKRAAGVAIIDLDAFKPINDTFGHLTGDRILRDIGALFIRRTRTSDLIARYGGDEFVLLVTDLPIDELTGAAERLTQEIATVRWDVTDTTIAVTATFGVAHSSLLPNATVEQLLDTADRDLYAKKWVRKNPAAPPHLYEYPGGQSSGNVVPLPAEKERSGSPVAPRPAVEE